MSMPRTGDTQVAGVNGFLLRSALVAALGGLLFGFDTAVIAGTTRALTSLYGLSEGLLGVTVSSALWGTVLGSIFAAAPSNRYGRLACLRALAVLYVVLWASAYVPSKIGAVAAPPLWFLVARFLVAGGVMALIAVLLRRPFPGGARPASFSLPRRGRGSGECPDGTRPRR
jgi:MFS family permease